MTTTATSFRIEPANYIDGQWQRGAGETVDVFAPVDGEVLAKIKGASVEQLSEAVEATVGPSEPGPEPGHLGAVG